MSSQLKTLLDNADGQLARLTGSTSAFGRYLDSELDLLVNAALFAAAILATRHPAIAAALAQYRQAQTAAVLAQPDPRKTGA